jgi:xylan 1,4-beta-xylosidase
MIAQGPAPMPILPGFYPDPSICRVGDEYYLVSSTFEYFPAVPLFHSRDLKTWRQIGNVLNRPEQFRPRGSIVGASGGIYAPTLRHHDGRFWLITTDVDDMANGQLLVTATDPEGPWSDPIRFPGLVGIDPDLAWDDQGTCFLTYSEWTNGGIVQAAVDPETGVVLEGPRPLWSGTGMNNPEGPHLFQRDSWWYLLIAEGGTHTGHSISVARAPHPTGPFESAPHNPVLSHRSTRYELQATGHADLVERPDGTWAAVHLGIRQSGSFPRFHVNGRETFLAEVDWKDGWPHIGTHLDGAGPDTHAFELGGGYTLDPRWISPGADPAEFAEPTPGGIRLASGRAPGAAESGRVLAVRVTDPVWSARAHVDGDVSFALRIDPEHFLAIERTGSQVVARAKVGPFDQVLGEATVAPTAPLALMTRPDVAGRRRMLGPDLISAGYLDGDTFVTLAEIDGRYFSTEVAGGFTGRVLALEALSGSATICSLVYAPRSSTPA